MESESAELREETQAILDAIPDSRLTPDGWRQVTDALADMPALFARGDYAVFRKKLYLIEDLVDVPRTPPRQLSGGTSAPPPETLERMVLVQDAIGAEKPPQDEAEE